MRRLWWKAHDRIEPALPRKLKPCHCRSYHRRTGEHVLDCPRRGALPPRGRVLQ